MGTMRCPIPRPARVPLAALITGLAVILAGLFGITRSTDSDNKPGPRPAPSASASSKPSILEGDSSPVPGTDPDHVGAICFKGLNKATVATLERIWKGGPYPYPGKDGTVFQNRGGTLPKEAASYYHEFTVILDPSDLPDNRGTQRVITGGKEDDKVEDYYTGDHYKTFQLIDYTCGASTPPATPTGEPSSAPSTAQATPTGEATATPPAGTDTSKVGAMCFKSANPETVKTLELIHTFGDRPDGHFPYPKKDGSSFDWRENDKYPFPQKADGYYKEWTIPTPGVKNRGTQRIVTGGAVEDKIEDYYTGDHYKTFQLIDYGC
jgi:ribonuclease T1